VLVPLQQKNNLKPGFLSRCNDTPKSPVALFQSTHPPTANWFVFRGLMKMLFRPTAVLDPWKAVRFCPPSRRPHLNMRVCASSLRSNCRRMDRGTFTVLGSFKEDTRNIVENRKLDFRRLSLKSRTLFPLLCAPIPSDSSAKGERRM
jgi:hypothetical protein